MNRLTKKTTFLHNITCFGYYLIILFISSCAGKKYDGEGYKNYPDMKTILEENFKAMMNSNMPCKLIQVEGGRKDTTLIHSSKVNWNEWKNEMMLADINQEIFSTQYKISVIPDTIIGTLTYMYSSLKPNNLTNKIIITSREYDNAITSIYAETHDEGFFLTSSSKILFAFGRSLQIQHSIKKPFCKRKETVKTLMIGNPA